MKYVTDKQLLSMSSNAEVDISHKHRLTGGQRHSLLLLMKYVTDKQLLSMSSNAEMNQS